MAGLLLCVIAVGSAGTRVHHRLHSRHRRWFGVFPVDSRLRHRVLYASDALGLREVLGVHR